PGPAPALAGRAPRRSPAAAGRGPDLLGAGCGVPAGSRGRHLQGALRQQAVSLLRLDGERQGAVRAPWRWRRAPCRLPQPCPELDRGPELGKVMEASAELPADDLPRRPAAAAPRHRGPQLVAALEQQHAGDMIELVLEEVGVLGIDDE